MNKTQIKHLNARSKKISLIIIELKEYSPYMNTDLIIRGLMTERLRIKNLLNN